MEALRPMRMRLGTDSGAAILTSIDNGPVPSSSAASKISCGSADSV